ncbi:nucleotidyl transferase AbiEii/AbiGii toxin family protein [Kitasatospora sp. NPDC049285]|uniref:nucleotidyl transferase AbiEii/AbiGii toxin family protein n=1 Tax=Kitasatospora sp. NPDC049285 TaxID=3157096 RepID=UPI003422775C
MTDPYVLRAIERSRRSGEGLPLTFRPIDDPRAEQAFVFDPALKQHPNAYRPTDPRFADPELATAWQAARRTAMDAVLTAVADSGWVDHLVLRGSVVLRAWFGAAAREPGDLDFVVTPEDWRIDEARTADLLHGLTHGVPTTGPVRFRPEEAVTEAIWTYERVPGRRLLLPWEADGLPGGTVQLDFVFNEHLPVPPERFEVAPGAVLNVATRELSLAWKLMWLVTDRHPQGKDLYDAVLLAESAPLRYELLRDVFGDGEPYYAEHPVQADSFAFPDHEWQHFPAEYPHLARTQDDYLRRLRDALAPTFAEIPDADRTRWWIEGWLAPLRAAHAAGGFEAAQSWLKDRQASLALAHRLLGRALGPDAPADLAEAMLRSPAWAWEAEAVASGRYSLERLLSW